jgi:DNA-directed RNA polymerase subunit beta'
MRTFHVGGTATGLVEAAFFKTRSAGKVNLRGVYAVKNRHNQWIVMNRKSKVIIASDDGRELEEFALEYGSTIFVEDGQLVKENHKIADWDAFKVIMTERGGTVQYVDLIENVTYQEQFEEGTLQANKIILERRDEKRQPYLAVVAQDDSEEARYYLPTGAILMVDDGAQVLPGDTLAKLPREEKRTKDITGGLPRVAELFEARIPKDTAILSEVDGVVRFGGLHRGQRRITVTTEGGEIFEYTVPRSRHLNVEDGEHVKAGDSLTSGVPNVHDILRILGPDEVQKYLVREIQEIYSLQGVDINDKHIEVIVRQMLRKVRVIDPGETKFVAGDRIDKFNLQMVNRLLHKEGKRPAVAKPILMGITKASLGTESFISAASFQETTRVLTEASLVGQVDYLYGLKENVVIGKLIPAGSGVSSFKLKYIGEELSDLEKQAREEEQLEIGLDKISLNQ